MKKKGQVRFISNDEHGVNETPNTLETTTAAALRAGWSGATKESEGETIRRSNALPFTAQDAAGEPSVGSPKIPQPMDRFSKLEYKSAAITE